MSRLQLQHLMVDDTASVDTAGRLGVTLLTLIAGEDQTNNRLLVALVDPGTNTPGYNQDLTFLASASRTTTQTSADLINYNAKGIRIVVDVTVIGTGSITMSINAKDSTSGKYINILTGVALVANGTVLYKVYPTLTAVANSIAQDVLPRVFQIVITANNANPVTYSVGYQYLQ